MPNLFQPCSDWNSAPNGTLGFYAGSSFFSHAIQDLEPVKISPVFIPSHVFIKFDSTHVVEAMKNNQVNSVAALDDASQYRNSPDVRFLIPPGSDSAKHAALLWLINNYQKQPYGTVVLFGFLLQKLFGLENNPLGEKGDVCSQAAWLYLREIWTLEPETKLDLVLSNLELDNAAPRNLYNCLLSATI